MSIEKSRYIDAVKHAYGSYVKNGGDGNFVLKLRGEALGYDESFLTRCNITRKNESRSIQELFAAFCGSGCPLRIDGDRHLPKEGDVVVDLGCGAGHDTILAGGLVGPTGHVFGVDFTQAMLDRARQNIEIIAKNADGAASKSFAPFTLCGGRIDDPSGLFSFQRMKKGIADVVISNGVFNLCANKSLAFRTSYELLKPGGKLLLNDLCIVEENLEAKISCTVGDEATS